MTSNKTVAQAMTAAEHAVAGILLTTIGARNIAELARTIVAAVQAADCGATTRARVADHEGAPA